MSTRTAPTGTSANELPTPSQPRIGLVGDTHADTVWTTSVIKMFAQQGIDMIVQLGDFGWWPHLTFADTVARCAARHDVTFAFIKATSFGLAVTSIGCYFGLYTRGGAAGVGRNTTRAVVASCMVILALDAFWAVVLL